ncbi:twin-arginine translocase TatA/TatE family subunit [Brachybacterium sp. p3-SID1565]|uniref:Twin-arginine translocase TatA/TatE family subunit n=1 Tax=Brachybacterium epidermidis TaxID=2781983 RepID=A0ABR9W3W6_9MICO|nr:twin-arginine translocase TatA/TatE family subunit [Brachybacterium sp. p3-SID1565]MBE9405143.1 twin-arginine translocase TatA/TatE family subunit [Brachybacterium epidermidis]MCT1385658.1 twin-arginine translocase TatA/TatE family subunit [Brachybacterium sp. p3-SID1565]
MSFLGLSGWEPLVLLLIFLIIIGPQRLPEYTRNIVRWVRDVRRWVEDSRATVEDEMGIAIDDLRKYDPRQYDPRRIIREAWGDTDIEDILPSKEAMSVAGGATAGAAVSRSSSRSSKGGGSKKATKNEGPKRAPFDPEAT